MQKHCGLIPKVFTAVRIELFPQSSLSICRAHRDQWWAVQLYGQGGKLVSSLDPGCSIRERASSPTPGGSERFDQGRLAVPRGGYRMLGMVAGSSVYCYIEVIKVTPTLFCIWLLGVGTTLAGSWHTVNVQPLNASSHEHGFIFCV